MTNKNLVLGIVAALLLGVMIGIIVMDYPRQNHVGEAYKKAQEAVPITKQRFKVLNETPLLNSSFIVDCVDSDLGNPFSQGVMLSVYIVNSSFNASLHKIVYNDTCITNTTLFEYTCRGLIPVQIVMNCAYGCRNGACA